MGEIADMMINGECCQECGGEHKLASGYYDDKEEKLV